MSLTTFISQNLGAKKYDRAKKGARFGITCSLIMAECIGIIIYFASPVLIAAFNSDPDVVAFGVQQARTVTLFIFPAGIFSLSGRTSPGSRKIHHPHVCHDDLLVHHPGKLYYHYRKADPLYSGDLLGLSSDLDTKLHCISDFLSEIRLAAF